MATVLLPTGTATHRALLARFAMANGFRGQR
jgi:hypothetical protein